MKELLFVILLGFNIATAYAQKDHDITRYGASITAHNNATSIQKAIDAAAVNGGGRVIVPAGRFTTGPVVLKNNVELHLAPDAELSGSTDRLDYTVGKMALISAQGQHHVSITGKGTINGQAHLLISNLMQVLRAGKLQDDLWRTKRPTEQNRPNLLFFKNCKQVRVTGVTLRDAASWVQNYKECDGVRIDSMTVNSTAYWNNDGIDIVDSKNVTISNSYFNAADDAICLKSEIADGACENVLVENCTLRSSASGFKLGTGSLGGFKNIKVSNLKIYDTYRSAIALEAVDGGNIENVEVNGVNAQNTGNAIFIRLGHRNQDQRYSTVNKILIQNMKVEVPAGKPDIGYPMEGPLPKVAPHNLLPSSITGLPGHPVTNITLRNIDITYGGGASKEKAYVSLDSLNAITENPAGYPEFTMFGELPSWALYTRHAQNIKLEGLKLNLQAADFRPGMVFDDVTGLIMNKVAIPKDVSLPALVYKNVQKLSTVDLDIPSGKEGVLTVR
ncbi:right-handed parallel beta-helix repeat-containing protein [Mucilaginibacter daejeonensis]|uniref:glycoside hydrolase family 28 protein n=1 Tax=Mucilaginibacter daejeonensis TaxID=398049 RepID=UPI001D17A158|nr:glycosyl hydrolase family 28 protein [Mucilaginibacter daejeonensis]UEG51910.1 right-handed parallel beta-helix repeat-containing protein [Mucilaginibacter daejeonensis]